jgi:thioredoxin 1
MHSDKPYLSETEAPTRAEVDALPGWTLLEFGTSWCSHCRAAEPALTEALAEHGQWQHIKVEDGPGQALGRSFRVKLWPTLVLLCNGQEVGRLVRPTVTSDIADALSNSSQPLQQP